MVWFAAVGVGLLLDGVVTSRDAEPGSTVVAGQAVVKLGIVRNFRVT